MALTVAAHTVWLNAAVRVALHHPLVTVPGVVLPWWWLAALLSAGYQLGALLARHDGQALIEGAVGLVGVCLVLAGALGVDARNPDVLGALRIGFSGWEEGLPPGAPVAVVATIAWTLGVVAGRGEYDGAWLAFWVGVVGTGALLLLAGPALLETAGVSSGPVVALYVACGLGSLSLRAAYDVGALDRSLRAGRLGVSRPWLATVAVVLVAVIVVGWAAAQVVSPDLADRAWAFVAEAGRAAGAWLRNAWQVLRGAWGRLMVTLGGWLGQLLAGGAGSSGEGDLPPLQQRGPLREPQEGERDPAGVGLAILVAAAAAGVWLVSRGLGRRPRRRAEWVRMDARPDDERETLRSSAWVDGRIGGQSGRMGRRGRGPFLPLDEAEEPRRAARLLYRRYLRALWRSGERRAPGVTPEELARRVGDRLGEAREDVRTLTAVYETARYGSAAPGAEEVAEAARAGRRLERALRRQRR